MTRSWSGEVLRLMDHAQLTKKAFKGLAQLLVALAACTFLSAWTLRYWQGWLFVAVFGSAVTAITLYFLKADPALIERRLKAGPGGETQPVQKLIQSIASVAFLALIVVPGLDHRFGWSSVPPFVAILGDCLVLAGLFVVFLVFRSNSYTSGTIEVGEGQKVVSTGPYSVVRHPMYAGALVLIVGIPLALGSLWGLLVCIPMIAVLIWRLGDEENFLSKNLAGYDEYCAKTRYRLIPLIY
jgi:protein-S-isoprenylcysteine O-methyltransferase Ste14